MPPEERDPALLLDMHRAAEEVHRMTQAMTFDEYQRNRMAVLATERLIEIIGEAARGISLEFRERHPHIPWNRIIAQRHVIAHEYGAIDQGRLWHVARVLAPQLAEMLRPLLTYPPGMHPDQGI